jgi:hypothetical protein
MSVRFDAADEVLFRNAGLGDTIPQADPLTICGWMKLKADINVGAPLAIRFMDAAGTVFQCLFVDATGTDIGVDTSGVAASATNPLTLDQWVHVAYRRSGTTHEMVMQNGTTRSVVDAVAADTQAAIAFGGNAAAHVDCEMAYWRVWEAALTDVEIIAERSTLLARRREGLWADYVMAAGDHTSDSSGNGRTLRPNGSLTDGASVPLIITAQPSTQVGLAGGSATFTVAASGTGTLHYQWKRNGSNVGTDSASYTPTGLAAGTGDRIQVTVTDDDTSVDSDVVSLIVLSDSNTRRPWKTGMGGERASTRTHRSYYSNTPSMFGSKADLQITESALFTPAAAGDTGAANLSWGALALSAQGALPLVGAAGLSWGPLVLSSQAALPLQAGAPSLSWGALTLSASGTGALPAITGDAALSWGAFAVSAQGQLAIAGAAQPSWGAITLSSQAALRIAGSASLGWGALSLSAAGALPIVGSASPGWGALTLFAHGVLDGGSEPEDEPRMQTGAITQVGKLLAR